MWILVFAVYAVAVPSMKFIDTVQRLANAFEKRPSERVSSTTNRW